MRTLATLILLSVFTAVSAGATVITFDNRADFELATGATPEGAIPELPSGTEFSLTNLSFKNVATTSVNTVRSWSTLIDEPFDLAINGVENFDVDSSIPLYSFGFDFHEPTAIRPPRFPDTCNTDVCVDSTFQLRLMNGLSTVALYKFTRPKDSLQFVGIWTSDPFDRIELRETVGTADNEFFGNFTTGTEPIPEPASLALVGIGLAGLTLRRRRRA